MRRLRDPACPPCVVNLKVFYLIIDGSIIIISVMRIDDNILCNSKMIQIEAYFKDLLVLGHSKERNTAGQFSCVRVDLREAFRHEHSD
jgi:hypothetical protein